jgi:hypothetical protein
MEYMRGANTVKNMMDVFSQKHKERTDVILEPLQAMIQLGLLAYSPSGTKLAIHYNTLVLQPPTLTQGFFRWYAGDRKDDLYFLFHVFRRFIVWYSTKSDALGRSQSLNTVDNQLYKTLLHNAFLGIDCLIKTYKSCEMGSLVHVLEMYKTFLQRPYYFIDERRHTRRKTLRSFSLGDAPNDLEESQQAESEENDTQRTSYSSPTRSPMLHSPPQEAKSFDIDMIFIQTKDFYSTSVKTIIIETFRQLEHTEACDYETVIRGLNRLLYPITRQIEPWIKQKLVF